VAFEAGLYQVIREARPERVDLEPARMAKLILPVFCLSEKRNWTVIVREAEAKEVTTPCEFLARWRVIDSICKSAGS